MKSPQRPKENETPTCNRLGRDDHLGHLLLDIGHCAGASTPRFARHPPDTGSSLPRPKHMVSFLPGGVGLERRTPPSSTPLRNKKNLALRPSENFSSPSASSELVGLSSLPTNQVNRWQHLHPLAQSAHSAHSAHSQPYSIGLLCQDLPQDRSHPQRHHWRSVRSNLVEMVPTPEASGTQRPKR